ncbi:UNVERIFIED_CONTAM: putative mitochondrial protein [Sesamum angustifolium]|uniref:Mitochondrial protein n=1 Tax=Sesamum angustifolium TaxID=2727405 RepID=A0AAW2M7U7_9LAMI
MEERLQLILGSNETGTELLKLMKGKMTMAQYDPLQVNFAQGDDLQAQKTKDIIAVGKVIGGLYIIDKTSFDPVTIWQNSVPLLSLQCNMSSSADNSWLWHKRLGHPSFLVEAVQEPKSFIEDNKHKHWREVMTKEIEAFEKNYTWDLAELPTSKKAIGSRWVYKVKLKQDGTINRYKARLVAKGYTQLDVNSAFVHGHLDEVVYMLPPYGYTKATGVYVDDVLLTDISFAVQQLSQFIQLPRQPHWETTLHLVHSLKGTPTFGLCFPAGASFKLTAYSDSDWASCPDKHRSVTGYYIFLGGSSYIGKSRNKPPCPVRPLRLNTGAWGVVVVCGFLTVWVTLVFMFFL